LRSRVDCSVAESRSAMVLSVNGFGSGLNSVRVVVGRYAEEERDDCVVLKATKG
uniref:Smr domain-containing protein n=1 Tax=Anisakis simplex TaxID=6269 RepID=A0A0M3KHD4_ANISI